MNENNVNCLEKILDCDDNEININNSCYSVKPIQTTSIINKDKNFISFSSLNGTDTNAKEGQHINTDKTIETSNILLGEFDNIESLNCILKCSTNPDCNAIQFNYGSDNSQNEFIENGYCQLYNVDVSKKTAFKNGNATPNNSPDNIYTCATTYNKLTKETGWDFEIINDKNKLQLKQTTKNSQNTPKIIKLLSKSQGGLCRKYINGNSDNISKSYLEQWCSKNQDMDVCKNFCSNPYSNCASRSIKSFIISIIITFISIFLLVLAFKYKKNKIYQIISVISVIISLIFLVINILRFIKPVYNGSQQDYIPIFEKISNCKNCSNIFSECISSSSK